MYRSPRRASTLAWTMLLALLIPILAACGASTPAVTSDAPAASTGVETEASAPAESEAAASVEAEESAEASVDASASEPAEESAAASVAASEPAEESAAGGAAPEAAESPSNEKVLVLGFNQAPETLFSLEVAAAITTQSVSPLGDCTSELDYDFQPTYCFAEFPTFENGGAVTETVAVDRDAISEEAPIFVDGQIVTDATVAEEAGIEIPDETFQLTVTYPIAEDLYWEDGEQVTAADAVEAFRIYEDPELQLVTTVLRDAVANVTADGDFNVVYEYQPGYIDSTYFVNFLGFAPEHEYGGLSVAEIRDIESIRPFSFGPYIVQEYVPGDSLTLVNNPYFADQPNIGTVVFKYVADSDQLLAQLESGEVDYAGTIGLTLAQTEQLEELEQAGTVTNQFVPSTVWEHLDFSVTKPDGSPGPFADVRVRQAMAYAINRQQIIDNVLFGRTTTMNTYVPSEHPAYPGDDALEAYEYNPDRARELLEEAGFTQDAPLQFYTTAGNAQREDASLIIQQNLADVGVEMELNLVDAGTVLFAGGENGTLSSRQFDIALYAWVSGSDASHALYYCDQIPTPENNYDGQNSPAWCDEEFTRLGKAANLEVDREAKFELDKEPLTIWNQNLPALPLYQRVNIGSFRPEVTGIEVNPTETVDLWNIQDVDITE